MHSNLKLWSAAGGCVVAALGLIAVVGGALGHGEWFGVAVLSCVALGVSFGMSRVMEAAGNESLRGGFMTAGPLGVTALVVVGFMYPGWLTPTMLAERVEPGKLGAQIQSFAHRKVVVSGVLSRTGESTGYIEGPMGSVEIAARGDGHESIMLPASGSEIEVVGIVRDDSNGLRVVTREFRILGGGEVIAQGSE